MNNAELSKLRENNIRFLREFEDRFRPGKGGEVTINWFDRIKDFADRCYRIAKAEQVAEIDGLKAQLEQAKADTKRIDFLADSEQMNASVIIAKGILDDDISSLRDAIDEAMKVEESEDE